MPTVEEIFEDIPELSDPGEDNDNDTEVLHAKSRMGTGSL
jgi:hypothetical protein